MTLCHCGQPLHYSDPAMEADIQELVDQFGEFITVTTPDGSWRVQRHYIALHGFAAKDLPNLGFEKVS